MNNYQKQLIMDFALNKMISTEDFIKKYPMDPVDLKTFAIKILEVAYQQKNAECVEYGLLLAYRLGFTKEHANILCELIEQDWHYKHEDLATALDKLKQPSSIGCLYRSALKHFEYLDYDESYALAVKCIWALGNLGEAGAQEAVHKLELLARSDNLIIQEESKNQLKRLK